MTPAAIAISLSTTVHTKYHPSQYITIESVSLGWRGIYSSCRSIVSVLILLFFRFIVYDVHLRPKRSDIVNCTHREPEMASWLHTIVDYPASGTLARLVLQRRECQPQGVHTHRLHQPTKAPSLSDSFHRSLPFISQFQHS